MHWGWALDGVNASIPRNTGPECVNYLSTARHVIESAAVIPLAVIILKCGVAKLPTSHINYDATNRIWFGKQLLLITMTALLGLEMGFKLCTRTAIYILNPCHVTSILQVYLLAAKPSKWTTALFRVHINFLNGPLLAFLFPEHDSRKITFELSTYYIQHGLMFVIPAYLLRQGGPYAAEKITDISYSMIAYGAFLVYHYSVLEVFAVSAQVNLNHMICPAILDPFQGGNYRLYACMHQALLCPIISKLFAYIFTPTSAVNELTQGDGPLEQCGHIQDYADFAASPANVQYKQHVAAHNSNVKNDLGKQSIGNGCDIDSNLSNGAITSTLFDTNKKSN